MIKHATLVNVIVGVPCCTGDPRHQGQLESLGKSSRYRPPGTGSSMCQAAGTAHHMSTAIEHTSPILWIP